MSKVISKPITVFSLIVVLILFLPKKGIKPNKEFISEIDREILFTNKTSMPLDHQEFILKLVPLIQISNKEILTERERLQQIISRVMLDQKVKKSAQYWLKKIVIKYIGDKKAIKLNQEKEKTLINLNKLLSRIDIVPVRLALAQAAIESGWGKSRFCLEGNAYFGIHCYSPDCGIKANADKNGGFEVKSYESAQESVNDYVLFLNAKRGMQRFRDERKRYLQSQTTQDLIKLAGSIKGYSAIGESYQQMIESILKYYIPDNLANF